MSCSVTCTVTLTRLTSNQQSKYSTTNVNYLKCHVLLAAIHFPLETTSYISYIRYVPPKRVGFLRRFGLKTGIGFAHFGLESGRLFEGPTGVNDCACHFNSK